MMKSCLLWLNVLADLFRFLVLSFRSESSLAAENLFLRKQRVLPGTQNQTPANLQFGTGYPRITQPMVQLAQGVDGGDAQNFHQLAAPALPALLG
jgi:hypothetical protein